RLPAERRNRGRAGARRPDRLVTPEYAIGQVEAAASPEVSFESGFGTLNDLDADAGGPKSLGDPRYDFLGDGAGWIFEFELDRGVAHLFPGRRDQHQGQSRIELQRPNSRCVRVAFFGKRSVGHTARLVGRLLEDRILEQRSAIDRI